MPLRVRSLAEVGSTNEEVKRALEEGEAEGLAVRAARQTGGYGRQGRPWASPEGGLYCSWLLRPEVDAAQLPTLSLVAGLAVRRALMRLISGKRADILVKWPNDVVVSAPPPLRSAEPVDAAASPGARSSSGSETPCRSAVEQGAPARAHGGGSSGPLGRSMRAEACGAFAIPRTPDAGEALVGIGGPATHSSPRKICGISLEVHAGGVCVGTGVNVLRPDARSEVGGKNTPAYLADLAPDLAALPRREALDRVFDALAVEFPSLYGRWRMRGFAPFLDEFNAVSSLRGRFVTLVDRSEAPLASGEVVRVDARGRLVVRDGQGRETAVSSGEVHLI